MVFFFGGHRLLVCVVPLVGPGGPLLADGGLQFVLLCTPLSDLSVLVGIQEVLFGLRRRCVGQLYVGSKGSLLVESFWR